MGEKYYVYSGTGLAYIVPYSRVRCDSLSNLCTAGLEVKAEVTNLPL